MTLWDRIKAVCRFIMKMDLVLIALVMTLLSFSVFVIYHIGIEAGGGLRTYAYKQVKKSQIGAWASIQSAEIGNKFEFEKRIAKYTMKYAVGKVPRPPFWGGYIVVPELIEFWEAREFRLHDRRVFERVNEDEWKVKKIYP